MTIKLATLMFLIVGTFIPYILVSAQAAETIFTEKVTFYNGEIKLSGTLTLPSRDGLFPAVVLISGSGPQDRNGATKTIPDYRPFAVIAEYLTRYGIGVLRYDDRGVKESTGNYIEATEQDFINDAEAAIRYLLNRKEIVQKKIGLLGHSEGSAIAATIAAKNPQVAFVISLAGGAVDGYNLLLRQAQRQAEAEGMNEKQVLEVVQEQRHIFDLVLEKKWEKLTEDVTALTLERLKALPKEKTASLGDLDSFARKRASRSVSAFKHPRYQFLLKHDFGENWTKISVPVLALFGELDVQCDAAQNTDALRKALLKAGNNDITIVEVNSANHLFLKAQTGSMNEYISLPKEFAPGFLESISGWLDEKVNSKK
jgi:pimeloyl-ACP methyl ester carboxylesterase